MSEQLLGIVKDITENGLSILIDGELLPTSKRYLFLDSYIPTLNDRVLISKIGQSYVVLGKLSSSTKTIIAEKSNSINNASGNKKLFLHSDGNNGKRTNLWIMGDGDSGWTQIK